MPFEDVELKPFKPQGDLYPKRLFRIKRWKFAAIIIAGVVLAFIIGYFVHTPNNKCDDYIDKYEFDLDNINPRNIQNNLKELTKSVHIAGTVQEEEVLVKFIKDRWISQLDHVEVHTYNVLLSYPNETSPNYVSMIDSSGKEYEKTPIKEPSVTSAETFDDVGNYFNAFGSSGKVNGQLVYVNYAKTSDFEYLRNISFKVNGSICIARYGKIFRGNKASNAEMNGCVGLIMFTDPKDYANPDNYSEGYPKSWWLPESGIQRGTLFLKGGDPLTPDYPSLDYMYNIPEKDAGLPSIPVHPISFQDAFNYLSKLGGDDAPDSWQGGLNVTYKLGGVFKHPYKDDTITIVSNNYREKKNIRNVIGYIWGEEEPDRYILLGNHRDAWVYGTIDPSSGTAVMMEVARGIGESVKTDNWRPRRTIVFCSWGAEEYGIIGSFEWVDNYNKMLMKNAVVYFNVDIAVQGTSTLRAKSTPNLKQVLYEVAKKVKNPNETEISAGRPTVFDTWLHKDRDDDEESLPYVGSLGSGSDYTAFLQVVGVSSVDFRYNYDALNMHISSYPIYHSAHETIEYFEEYLDPDYKYMVAVGQIWAELAMRFSNDEILPFNCEQYTSALRKLSNNVISDYSADLKEHNISYEGILLSVNVFEERCANFQTTPNNKLSTRILNDKLMNLERGFIDFNGLPGQSFYRHVVYAPSSTDSYSSSGFPGIIDTINEAKSDGNWQRVQEQFDVVQFMIQSASDIFTDEMPAV